MKLTLSPGLIMSLFVAGAIAGLSGCRASPAKKANTNFFTSGSKEADQRASQRMAQAEQLEGSGEGGGEKGVKKAKVKKSDSGEAPSPTGRTNEAAQATNKLSLYERLGGQAGISNLVADFTQRALDDPRVNWSRQGVTHGGITLLHKGKSETWNPSPENVEQLKKHMVEFLALATGGPAQYTGKQIEAAHADMQISNPEFDAAIGDLKASLDVLKIPNKEQKELLAIVESTRPQIVTKR
jgi:hemoglobin